MSTETHGLDAAAVAIHLCADDADAHALARAAITAYEESFSSENVTVTGPYKYSGDLHPSFRISDDDRIIGSVYVTDGDEDRAEHEARLFARALAATPSAATPAGEAEGTARSLRVYAESLRGVYVTRNDVAEELDRIATSLEAALQPASQPPATPPVAPAPTGDEVAELLGRLQHIANGPVYGGTAASAIAIITELAALRDETIKVVERFANEDLADDFCPDETLARETTMTVGDFRCARALLAKLKGAKS